MNKSIENAQRKVEGHRFDIRKHLLEYDDVMNEQRKSVYQLRQSVIGAGLEQAVQTLIEDEIIRMVARCCPQKSHFDEWNLDLLEDLVRDLFGIEMELSELTDLNREEIETRIYYDNVMKMIEQKVTDYTKEGFYSVARVIYLTNHRCTLGRPLTGHGPFARRHQFTWVCAKGSEAGVQEEGYNLLPVMAGIGGDVLQKVSRVVITTETQEDYEARLEAPCKAAARAAATQGATQRNLKSRKR